MPVVLGIILLNNILLITLFIINILFLVLTYKMLNLNKFKRQKIRKYLVVQFTLNWLNIPIILMSTAPWAGLMIFYPIIGLISSNIIIYRTIITPQVL